MNVEVRKTETTYGETGVGASDRVDVTYELGVATPNGGWVRFASVPGPVFDAADERAQQDNTTTQPASPGQTTGGAEPTMQDVTPTPAPQAEAARTETEQV